MNIHFHVFGIAIIDVILTLIGAWLLAKYFKWSFFGTAIILFLLGIAMHRLFRVRTAVDKFLFSKLLFE